MTTTESESEGLTNLRAGQNLSMILEKEAPGLCAVVPSPEEGLPPVPVVVSDLNAQVANKMTRANPNKLDIVAITKQKVEQGLRNINPSSLTPSTQCPKSCMDTICRLSSCGTERV